MLVYAGVFLYYSQIIYVLNGISILVRLHLLNKLLIRRRPVNTLQKYLAAYTLSTLCQTILNYMTVGLGDEDDSGLLVPATCCRVISFMKTYFSVASLGILTCLLHETFDGKDSHSANTLCPGPNAAFWLTAIGFTAIALSFPAIMTIQGIEPLPKPTLPAMPHRSHWEHPFAPYRQSKLLLHRPTKVKIDFSFDGECECGALNLFGSWGLTLAYEIIIRLTIALFLTKFTSFAKIQEIRAFRQKLALLGSEKEQQVKTKPLIMYLFVLSCMFLPHSLLSIYETMLPRMPEQYHYFADFFRTCRTLFLPIFRLVMEFSPKLLDWVFHEPAMRARALEQNDMEMLPLSHPTSPQHGNDNDNDDAATEVVVDGGRRQDPVPDVVPSAVVVVAEQQIVSSKPRARIPLQRQIVERRIVDEQQRFRDKVERQQQLDKQRNQQQQSWWRSQLDNWRWWEQHIPRFRNGLVESVITPNETRTSEIAGSEVYFADDEADPAKPFRRWEHDDDENTVRMELECQN